MSDAKNTGQLGHESRLKLMATIADAKAKGLFPANSKVVDALPGREVPISLVDDDVIPVACKQQQQHNRFRAIPSTSTSTSGYRRVPSAPPALPGAAVLPSS